MNSNKRYFSNHCACLIIIALLELYNIDITHESNDILPLYLDTNTASSPGTYDTSLVLLCLSVY